MSVKISNNSKEVILDIETAVQAEAVNKVREIAEYGRDIVESVVIESSEWLKHPHSGGRIKSGAMIGSVGVEHSAGFNIVASEFGFLDVGRPRHTLYQEAGTTSKDGSVRITPMKALDTAISRILAKYGG